MTVANVLAELLGRSSDLPILTAEVFDWLSLFVLVLNPILNVACPFQDLYCSEKNSIQTLKRPLAIPLAPRFHI